MQQWTQRRGFGTTSCLLALCSLLACKTDADVQSVRVDLRTDFVSGVEFDSLRVQFGDGDLAESQDRINRSADDFLRGQRVASSQAPVGPLAITITLYRSLEPVIARRVTAQIRSGINIAPIVISRSCEGVECPNADPALASCLGGRCVDPRCTSATPEFCPAAQCTNDSECEAVACAIPECSDGVCFSIPDDSRCADSERCDGILGCVPRDVVRDAGFDAPSQDAGIDGGVFTDAGMDMSMPDVPIDVFDAGPGTGDFSAPRLLSELTMGAAADDPTLTQDLLQIFFKSVRPLQRIWTARRSTLGEPFENLTQVDAIFPDDPATSPELREDGLVLFFAGQRGGDFDVFRATRTSLGGDFSSIGTPISEVNTGELEFAFGTNAAETVATFRRGNLFETRRATMAMPWGIPTMLTSLNRTGTEIDSQLIGDGHVLYFAGTDPDNAALSMEIWRAERPSLDAPFEAAVRVESVSSSSVDTDPWVSSDERVMVFMSQRDGRQQLYVATRDGGVF